MANPSNHYEISSDKILVILISILLFISPLLYVGELRDPSNLPRYALLAAIVTIALLIFVFNLFKNNSRIFFTPISVITLGFLLLAGISGLWAVETSNHLIYLVQLISLVILFFIASQCANSTSIRIFIYTSLFAAGLSALIGILQNYGYDFLNLKNSEMGGTFTYKNHAALYFDLIIPGGIFIAIISENKLLKWLSALALSICCIYIVTSHTRGSYVAMTSVAGILIILCLLLPEIRKGILSSINKNKLLIFIVITIVTIFAFQPGRADKFLVRPAYQGDTLDTSSRDRLTVYRNAVHLFKENPLLGSGYGTFWKAFKPFMNHPNIILRTDLNIIIYRMHNDILQIFVELGLLGGLLFVSILLGTLIVGIKIIKSEINLNDKLLMLGLLLSLTASFIHSLVDFPFLKPSSAIQIWLYLGLVSGIYAKKNNYYTVVTLLPVKVLFFLTSTILVLAAFIYYRAFISGSYLAHQAEKSFKNENCHATLEYIDASVKKFPHELVTHKKRVGYHIACNKDIQSLYNTLNNELLWDNTDAVALMYRARILLASKQLKQAQRDFNRVAFLFPHRPNGYIGEAKVLIAAGKVERAKKLLNDLEIRFPNDEEALSTIIKLKTEMNNKSQ